MYQLPQSVRLDIEREIGLKTYITLAIKLK